MIVELELGHQNKAQFLKNRNDLISSIEEYKKKYNEKDNVPRPKHWSGWNLSPLSIEFWLDGEIEFMKDLNILKMKMEME